jgi:hypothetical protein
LISPLSRCSLIAGRRAVARAEPRQKQGQRLGGKSEQEIKFGTNRNRDNVQK